MMPRKPKAGGYIWHERLARARELLRRQKRVPAEYLDGRVEAADALIAMQTLGLLADEELETLQRETKP